MTLGLLCRTDQGGLATQTQQLVQHLRPDVVLAIDLPEPQRRGDSQLHRLAHQLPIADVVTTDRIPVSRLTQFAEQVDTLVTVECLYTDTAGWNAVNARTHTVLIGNPELYGDYPAQRLIFPTSWCLDRLPPATVVPHPVDVDAAAHCRALRSGPVRTFLAVEAPAMLDRNGTELVAAALARVTEPCTVIVRSHRERKSGPLGVDRIGRATIVWDNSRPENWVDCYHYDVADVLLLPRRYGGLSMVVQEAAALGMPTVMLDVDPQRGEDWPGWRVPARVQRRVLMRGGEFDVHMCEPDALADLMRAMIRGDVDVEAESRRALEWADARSWPRVEPLWADALSGLTTPDPM